MASRPFDPTSVICTDIHTASLEVLSAEEVARAAVVRVNTTVIFDESGPRRGGLHDPSLGPLDSREPCPTCGARRECPGHIGRIELPIPAFHPTLLTSLVRLLKTLCLHCRRLRVDPASASLFLRKFQFAQFGMLAELQMFEQFDTKREKRGTDSVEKRAQLLRMFRGLRERRDAHAAAGADLPADISCSHNAVEAWSRLRSDFFRVAIARGNCAHCARPHRAAVKLAAGGGGGGGAAGGAGGASAAAIELSWPHGSERPFVQGAGGAAGGLRGPGGGVAAGAAVGDAAGAAGGDARSAAGAAAAGSPPSLLQLLTQADEEEGRQLGKRGKMTHSIALHAYHLVPLLRDLWSSPDRILLEFLFPASLRSGPDIFFLFQIPVSANRFRPLAAASFGGASDMPGGGMLSGRTTALLDVLRAVEKVCFAHSVLSSAEPVKALEAGGGPKPANAAPAAEAAAAPPAVGEIDKLIATGGEGEEGLAVGNEGGGSLGEKGGVSAAAGGESFCAAAARGAAFGASGAAAGCAAPASPDFQIDHSNFPASEKEKLRKVALKAESAAALFGTYARELQTAINTMIDSNRAARNAKVAPGVKQWMEKKQGAIRQKMMGKRVNFAARTVIAPDNCLGTNEIGIPVEFAKKLTIEEYVTRHSAAGLARLVARGAHTYPGANAVQDAQGRVFQLGLLAQRERDNWAARIRAAGAELQTLGPGPGKPPLVVLRHVRDGDVVIMNRQPTLHRASMMAHFVRVLRGWKTFRMMYVNCGSYNADFDGDEMNMHLPQDVVGRAEAQLIVNADCHYITAKDAGPLRGLIQDHVLGGVFLTQRGTFLTGQQYYTLLYSGLAEFVDRGKKIRFERADTRGGASNVARAAGDGRVGDPYFRVLLGNKALRIVTEPPTILKPEKLWTGKQVINSIIKTVIDWLALARLGNHADPNNPFTREYRGFNFQGKSKTPGDAWNGLLDGDKEESTIIIKDSELLQGVFDKSMFGASSFGLVHTAFELLGPRAAGILLGVFAKTFTVFLQMRGFSCCTGDFLMTRKGELNREKMVARCTLAGNYLQEVFTDAVARALHWDGGEGALGGGSGGVQQRGRALLASLASVAGDPQLRQIAETRALARGKLGFGPVGPDGLPNPAFPQFDQTAGLVAVNPANDPPLYGFRGRSSGGAKWGAGAGGSDAAGAKQGDAARTTAEHPPFAGPPFASIKEEDVKVKEEITYEKETKLSVDDPATHAPIDFLRRFHLLSQRPDWRLLPEEEVAKAVEAPFSLLRKMGSRNPRVQGEILKALATTPDFALHFPKAAQLLGTHLVYGAPGAAELRHALAKDPTAVPPIPSADRVGPARPNDAVALPSGRIVEGDGAARSPVLYNPSWLFAAAGGGEKGGAATSAVTAGTSWFEDSARYALRGLAEVTTTAQLTRYHLASGSRPFFTLPNELTRIRVERLCRDRFAGREEEFFKMVDSFFQSGMGKITGRNNDLVSGDVTLYPFPHNGFASMITTGAKGSKVNFAMICGMLSQQSLEGRRVPVMLSGKTLPSFARFDLGARAGGLITDRYLTGLRPQEFFFHCMAGREGLVDTAVKTARSGYLQRCVMKGMEGMTVQYDGTVRDSDGTIIQFLYGEDGLDVARSSFQPKLDDLMQNPSIMKAKYGSEEKRRIMAASLLAVDNFIESAGKAAAAEAGGGLSAEGEKRTGLKVDGGVADVEIEAPQTPDPLSHVYPPMHTPGSVSEAYLSIVQNAVKRDAYNYIPKRITELLEAKTAAPFSSASNVTLDQAREIARREFRHMLLTRYAENLCMPGEAVGCLSAQSMGEPATQMTLNTFHLAGHGAANVTLGIPRLREILQTAGNAQTPFLYIPLRGATRDEATRHAEEVLLGFKRIPLTDVVHSIGVESKVYLDRSVGPAYSAEAPKYLRAEAEDADTQLQPKYYWEYETVIQFENLDHFAAVVPKFTPQKIVALTISRCVREMMKQVHRLVYLYAAKYAEETLDSSDDELQAAADRFIFERNWRSQQARKERRRERARAAGFGFGQGGRGGDHEAAMDLETGVDVAENYKRPSGKAKGDDEGGESKEKEPEEEKEDFEEGAADDEKSEATDAEANDSEVDFSGSELGDDAKAAEMEDDEEGSDGEGAKGSGADSDSERSDGAPAASTAAKRAAAAAEEKRRARASKSRWTNVDLNFDADVGVLNAQKLPPIYPDELDEAGMWSDSGVARWKLKLFPDEAYRYLTDLKMCRKTWRLTFKFGWPVRKCPRRVAVLDAFTKVLRKQVLQDTPGVSNPRLVGGSSETKAAFEVQCQGSNFAWVHRLKDRCVDHNRILTNDIRAVLQYYGVEACRQVITRELNKVFSVYGIVVNMRHMSLIADAMTLSGHFRPFSRLGVAHHSSPFLQMSFETSMKFLTEAVERAATDDLRTPAGALVAGRPAAVGAGLCRVLPKLPSLSEGPPKAAPEPEAEPGAAGAAKTAPAALAAAAAEYAPRKRLKKKFSFT